MTEQVYNVLHLYSGSGGGALGFQEAQAEFRGIIGRFRTLCGIDVDPQACADFEALTGAPAVRMDLFSREDYAAWHGHEPPAEWREATPDDIRAATGGESPNVVFLSPPCLPAEQPIITCEGPVPIGLVRAGDYVLTHKGRYERVVAVGTHEYKGTMVAIRLNGTQDWWEFTEEHPILVKRGAVGEFIPAGQIVVGDRIGFPIMKPIPGTGQRFVQSSLSPTSGVGMARLKHLEPHAESQALWTLLGMYLGDGYRRRDRDVVVFCVGPTNGRKDLMARQALSEIGLTWQVDDYNGTGNIKLCVHSKQLWELCGRFGNTAEEKTIPEELQRLEDALLDAFLEGYVATDGSQYRERTSLVGGRPLTMKAGIRIASVSLPLLRSVQRLMLRRGQYWKVYPAGNGRPMVIEGRTVNAKPLFNLAYHELSATSRRLCYEFDGDMVWIRVRSVSRTPQTRRVFNLEVDKDNTFCCHLIATHNCKGMSGLQPKSRAESAKYQALNNLTFRGVWLTLEAWSDDLPGLILLENVPRITTRGAHLLRSIRDLLTHYGYVFHESAHDCGELGGLAQHRRRYLLVARHPGRAPIWLYQPPKQQVRAIGEVLEQLPLPGDPAGGPLHRIPRLEWRTWVRLALIPAGKDWRALQDLDFGSYRITPEMNGQHTNKYRVQRWETPAGTVTGSDRIGSGAPGVADPRLGHEPRKGVFRVARWDEPSPTVIGSASVRGSNGVAAVADPRIPADTDRGVWVIVAEDGTWHRPLTTLELAALQGFPTVMPDGRPLALAGSSDKSWRERIGNAVPVPTAQAIAGQILRTLLMSETGVWEASPTPVWVQPDEHVQAM